MKLDKQKDSCFLVTVVFQVVIHTVIQMEFVPTQALYKHLELLSLNFRTLVPPHNQAGCN